jgi:hypothetical protein
VVLRCRETLGWAVFRLFILAAKLAKPSKLFLHFTSYRLVCDDSRIQRTITEKPFDPFALFALVVETGTRGWPNSKAATET